MSLVLDEVSVSIKGISILQGISLSVAPGEMVALVGPSGSGKSTTLHVLAGMIRPTSGSVRRSPDFAESSPHWIQQTVNVLSSRTALDNVALGVAGTNVPWAVAKERALEALSVLGLSTLARRRARTLSGGEAQRVVVARALVGRPQLVLADEPTGQLDFATSMLVIDAMNSLRNDSCAVVVATHDLAVADRCDRVVTVKNGRADNG